MMNSLIIVLSVCISLSSQSLVKPIGNPLGSGQAYCKNLLPKNYPNLATSIFSSALVIDQMVDIESYECDSGSYLTEITYNDTITKPYACYGYGGFDNNVTFSGHQGNVSVPLYSPQHTGIYSLNNGNFAYMECGVISGGPCDGDAIWDTGLWMADGQTACASSTGLKKLKGLYAGFEIVGKCASKCTRSNINFTFVKALNNNGPVL